MDGTTNYSLSDLAAITNSEGMGGNNAWWIVVLFLFMFMGGGAWGGNASNAVSQADLQRAIDLNSIQTGQANIMNNVQRDIYETTATIKDSSYNNLGEIRDVQSAVATGNANIINNLTGLSSTIQTNACATQRAIDSVNYNLASQSAAIQANDAANTQKILDALSTNRIADMQNQINSLQLQAAMCGVVRYPSATTYTAGPAPFYGPGPGPVL